MFFLLAFGEELKILVWEREELEKTLRSTGIEHHGRKDIVKIMVEQTR